MAVDLVGRDAEIAKIWAFLSVASGAPAALVITGDPGIGKTAVWHHALQAASQSSRILSCQSAPAERLLAFSALDDLFGDVAGELLPEIPGPRRRAIETALLLDPVPGGLPTDPSWDDRPPPEPRVLARGILDVLRILSSTAPLILAVDNAQWMDRPSAGALEFCFRRLRDEPVLILLTLRRQNWVPLGLERVLPPDRLGRIRLSQLSLDAIDEILRSRLEPALPRYLITRLYNACGGNPFYTLEYARELLDRPRFPLTIEPMPIPESLSGIVRHRVRRLTPDVRRVGRLIATSSDRRERLIRAACKKDESWLAIDRAVDEGLVERDGDVLKFTHPLLQSVLYTEMSLSERRQLHRRLGAVAKEVEERAWHLALGAERPSEEIARIADSAARHAASRAAPEEGATLAEQAARLTPASRPEAARDRMVRAADYHFHAGNMARSRELIHSALVDCPRGSLRASLLLRLATIHYHLTGWPHAEEMFRQAAEEVPDDPALCAHAGQELAFARMVAGDLRGALRLARMSLRSAERTANPQLVAHSVARIACFEFLQGKGVRLDLLDRTDALCSSAGQEPPGRLPLFDPTLGRGLILKWCDRLDEARVRLANQYRHALDCGNESSIPFLLYHFSELECWAGKWDMAEQYAHEARRVAEESRQRTMIPAALYSLALVRAHRGQVAQARALSGEALALCEQTGNHPLASQVLSVLGFGALSLGEYETVHSHLGRLTDTTAAFGLGEPGVVKFLPDEIEALAALGQLDLARSLTRQLEGQGKLLGRPWALATAARCRAQLAAHDGDLEGAQAACEQALSRHKQLPMPFELGRTLLVKGRIERRRRHKAVARTSLGEALDIFERLGAPLWSGKTRQELSKIAVGARESGLTDTEWRIATLVAKGQTNREIAAAMFVTANTVQTHIQHIFRKLSVRSRTELAAQLLTTPASPGLFGLVTGWEPRGFSERSFPG